MSEDFNKMLEEVLKNRTARLACIENCLRRKIANQLVKYIEEGTTIRDLSSLAKKLEISDSQVRKAFHMELGDEIYLSTIVALADHFGLAIEILFKENAKP